MLQDSDMQTFGVEHSRKSRTVDQLTGDVKTVAQMIVTTDHSKQSVELWIPSWSV